MSVPPTPQDLENLPSIPETENVTRWVINHAQDHPLPPINDLKKWCDDIRSKINPNPKRITSWGTKNVPGFVYYVVALAFWWSQTQDKQYLARYVVLKKQLDNQLGRSNSKPTKLPENDLWYEQGIHETRDFHLKRKITQSDYIISYSHQEAELWIELNMKGIPLSTILNSSHLPPNMKLRVSDPHKKPMYEKKNTKEHIRACLYHAMGHTSQDTLATDLIPGASSVFLGFHKFLNEKQPSKKYSKNQHHDAISSIDIRDAVDWINKKYEIHSNFCKHGCSCDWPKGIKISMIDEYSSVYCLCDRNYKIRFAYAWQVLEDPNALLGLEHITKTKQTSDASRYLEKKSDAISYQKMKEHEKLRSRERRLNWTHGQRDKQRFYERRYKRNNREKVLASGRQYDHFHNRHLRPQNLEYQKQYNQCWNKKWKTLKERCALKGRELSLLEEEAKQICLEPCSYCGIPPIQIFHGIDRFDNDLGYTTENSVSACGMCNCMKSNLDFSDWIQICGNIVYHHFGSETAGMEIQHEISYPRSSMGWSDYEKRIKDHSTKCFYVPDITIDFFVKTSSSPCYYCQMPPNVSESQTVGMDRVDSSIGYVQSNIVPCCSLCNRMKRDYDQLTFLNQCYNIIKHFHTLG